MPQGQNPNNQNQTQPQEQVHGDRLGGMTRAEYVQVTLPDGNTRVIPVRAYTTRTTEQGDIIDQTTHSVIYGPDGRPLTTENLQSTVLSWSGLQVAAAPGATVPTCGSVFHHGPNRTIAVGQDGLLRPDGTGICRECLMTTRFLGVGGVILILGLLGGLLKAAGLM